jgi:hypothetical protein
MPYACTCTCHLSDPGGPPSAVSLASEAPSIWSDVAYGTYDPSKPRDRAPASRRATGSAGAMIAGGGAGAPTPTPGELDPGQSLLGASASARCVQMLLLGFLL